VRNVLTGHLVESASVLAAQVDFPGLAVEADRVRLGILRTSADITCNRYRDLEGYPKLSLKKWSPIAARNDDLKVFSGRR